MANATLQKNGKWRVLVYLYTDEYNKRHYKSITDKSKRKAEKLGREFAASYQPPSSEYENLTLKEAYERYIKAKADVLSPSTIKEYKRSSKKDFPMLMHLKLKDITAEKIQIAISELSINHSAKTVRNRHGLLHSVIQTYNPTFVFNTRLPQKQNPDYVIPITSEINKLLEVANERIRVPILLASQGSLRRSEICALTPDDIKDTGVVVNKAAVKDSKGKIVIKEPKTKAGNRFCHLSPAVISEVRAWKYFGMNPSTLSTNFDRAKEKADVPNFSFHKLRHYWASELHARGIPDKYIAQEGGWESVDMLHKIYQHALRDHTSAVSTKIINIFDNNFNNSMQRKCNEKQSTTA